MYHDDEWGRPVLTDESLFERLSLETFQSRLSWPTILLSSTDRPRHLLAGHPGAARRGYYEDREAGACRRVIAPASADRLLPC